MPNHATEQGTQIGGSDEQLINPLASIPEIREPDLNTTVERGAPVETLGTDWLADGGEPRTGNR
jgi:hypothetical protein